MNFDAALQTYIAESLEQLERMEIGLLELEKQGSHKQENLDEIFRAAHTIKGSAGMFGLTDIVEFAHEMESVLDQMRKGDITPETADLVTILMSSCDHLGELIRLINKSEERLAESVRSHGEVLTKRLQHYLKKSEVDLILNGVSGKEFESVTSQFKHIEDNDDCVESENWHISLRFSPNCLRDGMDPLSFLRYLETLGEIKNVVIIDDVLPAVNEMDAESCYFGLEVSFNSDVDKQTIENVFEFILNESVIHIIPPQSRIDFYIELLNAMPPRDMRLGEMLVLCGSLTQAELQLAIEKQKAMKANSVDMPLGNIIVDKGMSVEPVLQAAISKQIQVRENVFKEKQSVRVDAEKLDQLINLVGELVIAGAATSLIAQTNGETVLMESSSSLNSLIEQVRDSALSLRMVEIGSTFSKFRRVVRDVSNELGKDVELIVSGAETELDKTVVEKISDPLMHLVRNSLDHGIESAVVRRAQGKSSRGIIKLNAYHDSGCVVIEVSDDGAGLDKTKIRNKAIEKGLVSEDEQLSDKDLFDLIFAPGFSTADTVSNLSGRGVGMDVVKKNITDLRGSVELDTVPGKGTVFRVRLPLTLAIIDGFHVAVNSQSFVIALDMVLECVELNQAISGGSVSHNYINLRGEVLPFIRLRDLFKLGPSATKRENIVLVQYAGRKVGLVVDELLGELQTVIKPLGDIFSHLQGVGGASILANGSVALILDVPGLVQRTLFTEKNSIKSAA